MYRLGTFALFLNSDDSPSFSLTSCLDCNCTVCLLILLSFRMLLSKSCLDTWYIRLFILNFKGSF